MAGVVLFFGLFVGGLVVGRSVAAVIEAATGDRQLATAVGVGVWLLGAVVGMAYGGLWLGGSEMLPIRTKPRSLWGRLWAAKTEGKLQTAELRFACVFAIIIGTLASQAQARPWVAATVAVSFAVVGGFIGRDFKRRVLKQRAESEQSDGPDTE
jgi:hypothetical protein